MRLQLNLGLFQHALMIRYVYHSFYSPLKCSIVIVSYSVTCVVNLATGKIDQLQSAQTLNLMYMGTKGIFQNISISISISISINTVYGFK